MRQIKFRALDNLNNWIYGIPQTSSTLHLTLDVMAQYFTNQRKYGRQNVFVKTETLGQFTGFYDCKGTEIYEGDILSDWVDTDEGKIQSKEQVFWNEGMGSWCLDCSMKQDKTSGRELFKELRDFLYEVTGNIYETKN